MVERVGGEWEDGLKRHSEYADDEFVEPGCSGAVVGKCTGHERGGGAVGRWRGWTQKVTTAKDEAAPRMPIGRLAFPGWRVAFPGDANSATACRF